MKNLSRKLAWAKYKKDCDEYIIKWNVINYFVRLYVFEIFKEKSNQCFLEINKIINFVSLYIHIYIYFILYIFIAIFFILCLSQLSIKRNITINEKVVANNFDLKIIWKLKYLDSKVILYNIFYLSLILLLIYFYFLFINKFRNK